MSGSLPLRGRRILVTRRPEQSARLVECLEDAGAEVVLVPAIEIVPPLDQGPLDAALQALAEYDWLAFTSANAVEFVGHRLRELERDLALRPRIASVGPATTRAIRESLGRLADLEPEAAYQAQGLAEALLAQGGPGCLLFPTSDLGRETLPGALRAAGWSVDVVVAYRTRAAAGLAARLQAVGPVDLTTFASPSAVAALAEAAPGPARGLAAAAIGIVTEQAARAAGMDVQVVAAPSTAEGLVTGIVRLLGRPGRDLDISR